MRQRKDRIRIHIEGKEFSVVGGSFQEMLAAVKQINGRRFVSELKVWQLPGTVADVQRQLDISGFQLEGGTPVSDVPPLEPTPQARPGGGDRIRILVGGHQLTVAGGSFQDMLAAVKSLPGRRFDAENKVWEIPGELPVIKGMIQAAGFQLEGAENIPLEAVPSMEPPDFVGESSSLPPFEPPDFLEDNGDFPFAPPDWWDEGPPPSFDDSYYPEEPMTLEEPIPPADVHPARPSPSAASASRGDQIRIRLGETSLVVSGGSFQAMLAVIKKIPGRRFNSAEKVWEIPDDVTLESVQQAVKAAGFVVIPGE